MGRFSVTLLIGVMWMGAGPAVRADTVLDFETAFNELVGWDPELAELAPAAAPDPAHDFVVGSKKLTYVSGAFQHLRVSAHSGPSLLDEQGEPLAPGEDPKGSVRLTVSFPELFFDVKGDVECLFVNGNIGLVAARIVSLEGALPVVFEGATHVTLRIFDFGNPGSPPPDDGWDWYFMAPRAPIFCAAFGSGGGGGSGNLIVHDASN
jgi:hypothetical protein